jgi:hypothetical protein
MDKRQKLLAIVAAAVLVTFAVDRFALTPWLGAMEAAGKEIAQARQDLASAEEKVRLEPALSAQWKKVSEAMGKVKGDEAPNQLASLVDQLNRKHDLKKATLTPQAAARPLEGGAFKEHVLDVSFQCSWESFVKLLIDLNNAEEFVRIAQMTVQSHYLVEKESWLDVTTLRLSTVASAAPGGPK